MATTLIGTDISTAYTHSITTSQVGINVESISVSKEPEFREDLLNISGHVQGQAVGDQMVTLTISGETIRSSGGAFLGLLLDDFIADETGGINFHPSKVIIPGTTPTPLQTDFVCQSQEVTQTRGSFESATVVYIARTNLNL